MEQHPETPIDAARKGLEQLERAPHPTTEHDHGPDAGGPPMTEAPGERHRGGPLPNQKR